MTKLFFTSDIAYILFFSELEVLVHEQRNPPYIIIEDLRLRLDLSTSVHFSRDFSLSESPHLLKYPFNKITLRVLAFF